MDDSLNKINEQGIAKLVNSEWFDVIASGKNTIVLDSKGYPGTIALHRNGENYKLISDEQSKYYESLLDTVKDIIK